MNVRASYPTPPQLHLLFYSNVRLDERQIIIDAMGHAHDKNGLAEDSEKGGSILVKTPPEVAYTMLVRTPPEVAYTLLVKTPPKVEYILLSNTLPGQARPLEQGKNSHCDLFTLRQAMPFKDYQPIQSTLAPIII